jgi:hypothetical protein
MRVLVRASDTSENNDYADFELTKDLAATLLTARKKLLELKRQPGLGLGDLAQFRILANGQVRYFDLSRLGDEGEDGSDSETQADLLTKEQRERLESEELIEVPADFQLYPRRLGDTYAATSLDWLVVAEESWWFESWLDGDRNYLVEMWSQSFDVLKSVL